MGLVQNVVSDPYFHLVRRLRQRTSRPSMRRAPQGTTAPAFRKAIKYRRCLVPADAFFGWQRLDAKNKQPFAIALKSKEPYAFAGLWEKWGM